MVIGDHLRAFGAVSWPENVCVNPNVFDKHPWMKSWVPSPQVAQEIDPRFYFLEMHKEILTLQPPLPLKLNAMSVDFRSPAFLRRRKEFGARDLLTRAVGGRRSHIHLCDATLGWGYESVLLAGLGYHVTACERSPVVMALTYDAWSRARAQGDEGIEHLNFILGSTEKILGQPELPKFAVIYLDPMYPETEDQSALPKKKMQILRDLLPAPEPVGPLVELAWQKATERVVLKRPEDAPLVESHKASQILKNDAVRFEVFLKK